MDQFFRLFQRQDGSETEEEDSSFYICSHRWSIELYSRMNTFNKNSYQSVHVPMRSINVIGFVRQMRLA